MVADRAGAGQGSVASACAGQALALPLAARTRVNLLTPSLDCVLVCMHSNHISYYRDTTSHMCHGISPRVLLRVICLQPWCGVQKTAFAKLLRSGIWESPYHPLSGEWAAWRRVGSVQTRASVHFGAEAAKSGSVGWAAHCVTTRLHHPGKMGCVIGPASDPSQRTWMLCSVLLGPQAR